MWTQFWDMHSGGSTKEPPYNKIYIEADKGMACVIFYNRFGHSPHRVTCTCCGEDYSVSSSETLEEETAYHRGEYKGQLRDTKTLEEYAKQEDVLIIRKDEITAEQRQGSIPEQGYVWMD